MTAVRAISGALDVETRREAVFRGDLLLFKSVPAQAELCALTDMLIRAEFGDLDPVRAQFALNRDDFLIKVTAIQKIYRRHSEIKRLVAAALEHTGLSLDRTYWDWVHLRVMPHGEGYTSRGTQTLGFHRDTWSSNVYAQLNWWAPIYPLTPERALAFYPMYWSTPLENTSAGWDLEEIRANRSAAPIVPEPAEPVDVSSELVIVPEPGDILCFSGAHLHASVPNTSGLTRFSIEVRTVDADDIAQGYGAPNIDGHAPRVPLEWFYSIADGTPLSARVNGERPDENSGAQQRDSKSDAIKES